MGMSRRLDILRSGLKREHTGSHNFSNEGGLEVLVCSLAEELMFVILNFWILPELMLFGWGYTHRPFSPRVCGAANPTAKSRGGAWEWLLTQPLCSTCPATCYLQGLAMKQYRPMRAQKPLFQFPGKQTLWCRTWCPNSEPGAAGGHLAELKMGKPTQQNS